MYRTARCSILLLFLLGSVPDAALAQRSRPAGAACFQLAEPPVFSFGSIDPDKPVTHAFVFRNSCNKPVSIAKIRPGCGCTKATATSMTVAPGKTMELRVTLTPTPEMRGHVSKPVVVTLKGNPPPEIVVRVSADVKSDLAVQPDVLQLPNGAPGTAFSGTVTVTNTSNRRIDNIECSFEATSYAVLPKGNGNTTALPVTKTSLTPRTFSLAPGEHRFLTVSATPEHAGQLSGTLRIKAGKLSIAVPVVAVVVAR